MPRQRRQASAPQEVPLYEDAVIDIRDLKPDPDNIRIDYDPELVENLKEAVLRDGRFIDSPVVYQAQDGSWRPLYGNTRTLGAQLAAREGFAEKIPVIKVGPPRDRREKLFLQMEENEARRALGPIELGRAFKLLNSEEGLTYDQILAECSRRGVFRKAFGKSWVSQLIALTELDEEVQRLINRGDLSTNHGLELRKLSQAKQHSFARLAVDERIPLDVFKEMVASVNRGGTARDDAGVTPEALLQDIRNRHTEAARRLEEEERRSPGRRLPADADHSDGQVEQRWAMIPAALPSQVPQSGGKMRALRSDPWLRQAAPELRDLATEAVLAGYGPQSAVELVRRVENEAPHASQRMKDLVLFLGQVVRHLDSLGLEKESAPADIARLRLKKILNSLR